MLKKCSTDVHTFWWSLCNLVKLLRILAVHWPTPSTTHTHAHTHRHMHALRGDLLVVSLKIFPTHSKQASRHQRVPRFTRTLQEAPQQEGSLRFFFFSVRRHKPSSFTCLKQWVWLKPDLFYELPSAACLDWTMPRMTVKFLCINITQMEATAWLWYSYNCLIYKIQESNSLRETYVWPSVYISIRNKISIWRLLFLSDYFIHKKINQWIQNELSIFLSILQHSMMMDFIHIQ